MIAYRSHDDGGIQITTGIHFFLKKEQNFTKHVWKLYISLGVFSMQGRIPNFAMFLKKF